MRLMRTDWPARGLRRAGSCTRGAPPRASRVPRRCENRFYASRSRSRGSRPRSKRARGLHLHVSADSADFAAVREPADQELPLGRHEPAPCSRPSRPGCDLPVLVDLEGNVSEGPGFNLFMVKDGTVSTPEGTCLDGITRQTALDLLAEQNVKLVLGAFAPDELRALPTRRSSPRPRAASCRSPGSITGRSAAASPARSPPASRTSIGSVTTTARQGTPIDYGG